MEQFFTSRIRRYFDLELPRLRGSKKRWPLLVALHGYEGTKESMMGLARRISSGKMVVLALQGPNQFFRRTSKAEPTKFPVVFGWGTNYRTQDSIGLHHRDLRVLIRLAIEKYRADPARVFLLGFSQTCSYNYRFAFTYPHRVRGVIAVCGGVPGDWNENRRYQPGRVHVLHIAALHDQWYKRVKNLEIGRQLARRAASLDFRFYNSTHRFPRAAIPHIRQWIKKHS